MDKRTLQVMIAFAVVALVSLFTEPPHFGEGASHCWISALIGGVTSLIGGGVSALAGNAQAKKAQEQREMAKAQLDDWYDTQMNTNILDRADTQSMLKAYRDTMDEQNRKFATNAIKGGASEEAKVAYAQQANKGYADAISKIAAQGQQRKDQVTDAYMQGMMNFNNQEADSYLQSGQMMSNAISGAFNSLGSAISGARLKK